MWFTRKSESNTGDRATPFASLLAPKREDHGDDSAQEPESGLLKTFGWVTAAMGAVAVGLLVGRELRQRYKFNRRTPYDLYAHSGSSPKDLSDVSEIEFGVGV